jgi:multidrug efflux pump subunit AcrA (membrane-fusion protein)
VLTLYEMPCREYTATVTRSPESVDLAARTMLTEVQVDNRDGSLVPGMYGEVKFVITHSKPSLIIPTTALVIDKNGTHVVAVTSDDDVHFIPAEVGQDMGSQIKISHGLHGGESLVTNPSDLLSEGLKASIASDTRTHAKAIVKGSSNMNRLVLNSAGIAARYLPAAWWDRSTNAPPQR